MCIRDRGGPKGDFALCKFLPSPTPNSNSADVYDMVITVGNGAVIGIDIKSRRSKNFDPETLTQKITQAILTSFPDAKVKL